MQFIRQHGLDVLRLRGNFSVEFSADESFGFMLGEACRQQLLFRCLKREVSTPPGQIDVAIPGIHVVCRQGRPDYSLNKAFSLMDHLQHLTRFLCCMPARDSVS